MNGNEVKGAVVLREVPFHEWMKCYATPAEKEAIQLQALQGLVPDNAVIHNRHIYMLVEEEINDGI